MCTSNTMVASSDSSAPIRAKNVSRLVLIEDDENVRRSTTMMLRARGYKVDAYRTGTEFLLNARDHGCDCLLIDYKMPRVDGLEVMRRLRGTEDQTPAIMITGFYSETLRNKALSAGFSDVLEKPALPNSLVEMIQKTVN